MGKEEKSAEVLDESSAVGTAATSERTGEKEKAAQAEAAVQQPSLDELTRQLEDAHAKAEEHWQQLLRARADIENLKRRHQRELENAHKYALENFSRELLAVWDSLELGISAANDESVDVAKLREGNALTLKVLTSVMKKFHVEQVDPLGEKFNPELHQAMSVQQTDQVEPNTVVTVMQKGYTLNDRLIRPALVIVSKAITNSDKPTSKIDEQA